MPGSLTKSALDLYHTIREYIMGVFEYTKAGSDTEIIKGAFRNDGAAVGV